MLKLPPQYDEARLVVGRLLNMAGVLIVLTVVLFPIFWMALASIRPTAETLHNPPIWIPREVTFGAFRNLLSQSVQLRYFFNTYIISLSTAFLSVGLGALSAYGFSRFRIKGAKYILLALLSLQLLPNVSLVLPFFNLSQQLHIHNTYYALIIADTSLALPIVIWLLKGFFDSIPASLEEAAMLDGCTRLQSLWHVVLPLALPGLIGTAAFAFLWAWNEFLFAVVLTSGSNVAPLTIRMSQFFSQYGRDWSGIMALNVIALIPLLIAFVWLQRWVIEGMTAGAVK
jgi:multiple sugar transport system permease protein